MDDGRPVVAFGSGELIKLQKLCDFFFNFSCNISLHSDSKQFHQINKWSITSHLHSLNTQKKKTMTYDVGNPGPGLGNVRFIN
jgi:hypothetical protein